MPTFELHAKGLSTYSLCILWNLTVIFSFQLNLNLKSSLSLLPTI